MKLDWDDQPPFISAETGGMSTRGVRGFFLEIEGLGRKRYSRLNLAMCDKAHVICVQLDPLVWRCISKAKSMRSPPGCSLFLLWSPHRVCHMMLWSREWLLGRNRSTFFHSVFFSRAQWMTERVQMFFLFLILVFLYLRVRVQTTSLNYGSIFVPIALKKIERSVSWIE